MPAKRTYRQPTEIGSVGWKAADGAEQAIDSSAPILAVPGKVSRPESGHSFRLPVCCLTEIGGRPRIRL